MNIKSIAPDKCGKINYSEYRLSKKLNDNLEIFKAVFKNDHTVIYREVVNAHDPDACCALIYIDGMVNTSVINDYIIRPLSVLEIPPTENLPDELAKKIIQSNEIENTNELESMVKAVLYGDTLLLTEGYADVLIINSKGFGMRGISEPEDEKTLRGPREGFIEGILTNISLIRRKLQTSDLKFESMTLGTRSGTKVSICYLDSLVNKNILTELKRRLGTINTDCVLSVNYIDEHIKDNRYSLFKTAGTTEKPDVAAARLLEGRIAVIVDGSPVVMTVPYLFVENFHSPDDYYINFYYGTICRLLRFLSFFITIAIPAMYVALLGYHQEMIPRNLLLSITAAVRGVPFPIVVECVGMIIVFEMLRETGIRMPDKVGQALSIVGALVVGQAAVEAKIVSAPTVIVVALAGVTGLMLPRVKGAIVILRLLFIFAASMLGIFGFFFASVALVIYIFSIKTYDIPYASQLVPFSFQDAKDYFVRMPLTFMKKRPEHIAAETDRK